MLLIRRVLRIMDHFVHALRVREVVFGGEVEWVCGLRDGEVSPGGQGRRHLVFLSRSGDAMLWVLSGGGSEERMGGQRWGEERI
jgi:hypothetical protein